MLQQNHQGAITEYQLLLAFFSNPRVSGFRYAPSIDRIPFSTITKNQLPILPITEYHFTNYQLPF